MARKFSFRYWVQRPWLLANLLWVCAWAISLGIYEISRGGSVNQWPYAVVAICPALVSLMLWTRRKHYNSHIFIIFSWALFATVASLALPVIPTAILFLCPLIAAYALDKRLIVEGLGLTILGAVSLYAVYVYTIDFPFTLAAEYELWIQNTAIIATSGLAVTVILLSLISSTGSNASPIIELVPHLSLPKRTAQREAQPTQADAAGTENRHPLFRQEVIEKQSSRHLGDVFLSSPLSYWAIIWLLSAIIISLICYAFIGEYSRKERVLGVLTPSEGLVQIIPSQAGSFTKIHVEPGDSVNEGEAILQIRDDTFLTGGAPLAQTLLIQMENEKARLVKQLSDIPKQYALTRQRLETRKTESQAEAHRYLDQIEVQARTVELEESVFKRIQSLLETEAASALEVSSQENRFLAATQNLNNFKNTRENILSEIKDIDAQIAMLPVQQSQAETDVATRISTLEQSIIRTDAGGTSVINSPVSGTIAAVTVRKGQKVSPQKTAISILPEGGKLQAELFVPTRAIGFVKPGQRVHLLYDAFPYQKFGFHKGTIADVSKTVVNSIDLTIAPQFPEPVFLVTVDIELQSISALGENIPLQAGMSLSADLILEDRKIWEWVLEPFLGGRR